MLFAVPRARRRSFTGNCSGFVAARDEQGTELIVCEDDNMVYCNLSVLIIDQETSICESTSLHTLHRAMVTILVRLSSDDTRKGGEKKERNWGKITGLMIVF